MNRKKIVIYIIVIITSIIILSVFMMFRNKKIYITKIDELDNIKISMLKLEDGVTTVIKQVPTTDDWLMTYNCDDETVKIYWDEGNRKLLMKNIKPTACVIKFEKSLSAVNVVSMYVDDIYVGELDPGKDYILVNYECANNETVSWKILTRAITIVPLNTNTHCKLYFEAAPFLANKIIRDNTPLSDASLNFAQVSSVTNGRGLYYTENSATYGEDGERIYYFRGRVENNWVSFAGKLWRIVRTTSEGGVKLAYSGDGSTTTSASIGSSQFNSNYNTKYYVGYTYNTSGYIGTQTNSTIKTIVDNWYTSNLSSYASYLSTTAIFCNDRSNEVLNGTTIKYPPYDRIMTNYRPTFACPSTNQSRYTASTETGNGYLSNPVALLTVDEINYAGSKITTGSLDSYIFDNATGITFWWTMSPVYFSNSDFKGSEFLASSGGALLNGDVHGTQGVRSSVSLKQCITVVEGNGNKNTPYTLSINNCI